MKHIINFSFEVTKRRGLIDRNKTTMRDFVMKLEEEVQEFADVALNQPNKKLYLANHKSEDFNQELADIVLVCFNIAKFYGIDIESELSKNIIKNMNR